MYSRGSLSRYPTGGTATAALINPSSYTNTTASRRSNSTSVNARSTLVPAPSPTTQYSHQSQLRSLTEPPFATTLSGGSSLTRGRQPTSTSTLSALPSVEPQHASQRRSSSTMHSGSLYSRERARADEQEYEMENPVLSRFSTTSERQSNLQTDSYGRPVVAPPADRLDRGMPAIAPQVTSSATPQGFRNLGNTCYMNAALQCVLHSSGNLVRLLRAESRNSERSPRVTDALLQLMENPDYRALLAVKDYVSRMNAEFTGTRQNDSHEFTRELLYGIHKEVNRIRGKPKYIEMKDIDGEDDSAAALRWMDYLKTHDDSVIYDVFGGFLRSVTKCDNCGHRSLVFDPMLDLSVQVSSSVGQSLHVMNSMEEITILCCEKCKKKNLQGRRQTVVVKWPQCLMIHLKRFSASGRKDAEPVSYPLNITQGTISENCIVVPKGSTFPSRGYTLSGVVLHHGSMGFGHYTAMVRQGTKWYECDDSRVTAVSERQALSATSAGYILFYSQD